MSYGLLGLYAALLYAFYPSATFSYLVCFQSGAIMALTHLPRVGSRAALAFGFLVIVLTRLLSISGPNNIAANTIGAALIIYAVLNGVSTGILRTRLLRLVGKVLYSLYLFHPPVI